VSVPLRDTPHQPISASEGQKGEPVRTLLRWIDYRFSRGLPTRKEVERRRRSWEAMTGRPPPDVDDPFEGYR
jgi:hypothetical protein